MTRTCDICGTPFIPAAHNTKRCSRKCVRAYHVRFNRKANGTAPIRTAACKRCGIPVQLKPKASVRNCACATCHKILRAESSARFQQTAKAIAIQRRHDAKPERKEYLRIWHQKNRKKTDDRVKARKQAEPTFRIMCNIRGRVAHYIRVPRSRGTVKYLGCTKEQLRAHLESLFKPGMTWENYGLTGWHIDHKKPLSSFQFFNPDGSENVSAFSEAMHFTNLQPLWYWENIAKGDKIQSA